MEAAEEGNTSGEEAGLRLPRAHLPTPRPLPCSRRFGWDKEALQEETQQPQAMGLR